MSKKDMLEDLKRSGLTSKDCKNLKCKYLPKEETKKLLKKNKEAYLIPYFNVDGNKLAFYRVRYLEPVKNKKTGKNIRYGQPSKTGCRLYFPPIVDWSHIATDERIPIIITEGEKKAAKVCVEGIPAIGLGGVWSFRSKKEEKSLIDDFNLITWKGRSVKIIFDSDLISNNQVLKAMQVLAKELNDKGAYVEMGCIPTESVDIKQGVDDYLLENSIEELNGIELEAYKRGEALFQMNTEVALIKEVAQVYNFEAKRFYSRDQFVTVLYADRIYKETVDDKLKIISIPAEWMKWPMRRSHERVVYSPGDEAVTAKNEMNLWQGWGVQPSKGSIKPWNDLLTFIFNGEEEFKNWFITWLAYPLQNPGVKLYSCVLLWSLNQRMGKSFIGYIMGKIYGDNYKEINEEELHGSYNPWAVNRQFILGDEITGRDKRRDIDKLKGMITRQSITVDVKYQPHYDVKDCINYLFTSNRPDALFVEDTDERMAVHEVVGRPLPREFYDELDKWYTGTGPAALFHHLLNEVDCSKFNPKEHAINSQAKEDMQLLSMSDLDTFVDQLKIDPDRTLVHGSVRIDRDLFTATEILRLYDNEGVKRTSAIAISKSLRRAGFRQSPMTQTESGSKRLWALRNGAKWGRSTMAERIDNYDQSVIMLENAKQKKFKREE